ncbi:MAG: dethiobiotin synthase [Gammaproteobacteria bacterium]|nr:dethiobiotin synthase [Gammaproteobacteria bacterium]
MKRGFFITGTDTGVGKTTATLALMAAFKHRGLCVAGMKPVAAGCEQSANGLRNDDALQLMEQASIDLPYALVNPYAFEAPVAPHIAAQEQGVSIELSCLREAYNAILQQVDVVLVEGAGGWLVPISATATLADVPGALDLSVITVVGLKLGCINHALLTEQAIIRDRQIPVGWIANHIESKTARSEDVMQSLRARLRAPCLGSIPFASEKIVEGFDLQLNVDVLL